jgi:rare lipoprotein A
MFIGRFTWCRLTWRRLPWRVAKSIACSAALIGVTTLTAHAASLTTLPQLDRHGLIAAFGAEPAETKAHASFAERFDVAETSAISRLLGSPTYQAPVFRQSIQYTPAGDSVAGGASTYDPTDPTERDSGDLTTSSGEAYDPEAWTAAIRTDLRDQFGGVRYGKNYVPTFALVEGNGLRLIVRINDVGPLRPGRVIDLNTRAMRYFDPAMERGVIENVKVTPLLGSEIATGPVEDAPAFASRFAAVWK